MEPGQPHLETWGTSGGDPPSDGAREEALIVCFATLCLCGVLDPRWLMRARAVSSATHEAVHRAFSLLPGIAFPAHVTGPDVLALLVRVAGANLETVCLEGCWQLSAVDIERILADLAARCPAVIEVNLTDCSEEAILRALATAAKRHFGAVSPADLRAMLLALAEGEAASRCPLDLLLGQIAPPRLRVADEGQGFVPGRDAVRKAVVCAIGEAQKEEEETDEMEAEGVKASVYDEAAVYPVALLLACAFSAGEDEETIITFDCKDAERALHLVAERGPCFAFILSHIGARGGSGAHTPGGTWRDPRASIAPGAAAGNAHLRLWHVRGHTVRGHTVWPRT